MTRLVHSESGFLRSLQISNKTFFAFVEGALDRPFYDRLLRNTLHEHRITYEIRAAQELPGGTGGKMSVLSLFRRLRRRRKLVEECFGKRSTFVFFLDKDIDDLMRKKARSPHLIYTNTYDLEGYLFSCGDLSRAIADSCGITLSQAEKFIGDQHKWIESLVNNWKEWTVLCIISQIKYINIGCTFDRSSAINPDLIQPTEAISLKHFQESLQRRLNITELQFNKLYSTYEKKIDKSITAGECLKYFKGKWLKTLSEKHIAASLNIVGAIINGAGEKITISLLGQVGGQKNCRYCRPFSPKLQEIVKLLN